MQSTTETRARAQAVLDYIAKYPDKHFQGSWNHNPDSTGCGTSMCIGGTATWLEYGVKSLNLNTELEASRLLGLSPIEADILFYDMNEKNALRKLEKVAAGEPFTEEDFYTYEETDDDEPIFNSFQWKAYQDEN